jgi:hypothetical protein
MYGTSLAGEDLRVTASPGSLFPLQRDCRQQVPMNDCLALWHKKNRRSGRLAIDVASVFQSNYQADAH